jgi:hypothetical protein
MAMKKKVPQAAVAAPRPHYKQHTTATKSQKSFIHYTLPAQHVLPAVSRKRARVYWLQKDAAPRKVREYLNMSEVVR